MGSNIDYTGPWTPLVLAAKLEAGAGQRPAWRREGDRVFLRGAVKVKAEETLETADPMFTLPAGARPPATCVGLAPTVAVVLEIPASGVVTAKQAAGTGEGAEVPLDGISFNLTE